ncbi:MAG: LysM peptidoglycan-binding domain-containing M23 family metallopeptidase [Candidatus Omnitrophica bacterium]|nr:LysM peptidoglycan-binding domain-containing M23 family metallopeptidase [Candidatus Omnitrophota bacterium]
MPAFQGSSHKVRRCETLWRIAHSYGLDVRTLADANQLHGSTHLKEGQQLFVPLPKESHRFLWPVLGSLRASSASWVDIAAPAGSPVRAVRSGRVAVACRQLSGLGKTVVLDHLDGHLSVYAGLDQIVVSPGAALKQGMPIGILGSRALHFEIRRGITPRNVLALLPAE